MEKLEELALLQTQVEVFRLQDKLDEQNFRENIKKVFESVTDTIKNISLNLTQTRTKTSIKNKKALENINNKLLEIMIDRGILATFLMSPLSKITNPENTSQFKLVKDSGLNRLIDLLIQNSIPITSQDNLLNLRDTGKEFYLKGDILKMRTNKNSNIVLASLQDKKLMYDFCKGSEFWFKSSRY